MKKDSHDSGKPPSRDSFERKQLSRKQTRRKRTTAKRRGGQAGACRRHAAASGAAGHDYHPPSGELHLWLLTAR